MKMYLISDNADTLNGMRLAGIPGVMVRTRDELKYELHKTLDDKDIGIVLIMERLAAAFPEIIDDVKLNRPLPLIVEIPDRHGFGRRPDFLEAFIREAVGVKL